jgi:hypothetical protein
MKIDSKFLQFLFYPILGLLVFYGNSQLDINYFFKGYLSLLELQIGVVLIFIVTSKIRKSKAIKSDLN